MRYGQRSRAAAASKKNDAEGGWDADEGTEPQLKGQDPRYYFRVCRYFLLCVMIILTFSYSFERKLRGDLVNQFTAELEKASEAIFAEKQKSQMEQEEEDPDPLQGPDGPCPVCGAQSPLLAASSHAGSIDGGSKLTVQDVLDSWRSRHDNLVEGLTLLSRELLRVKFGAPPFYSKFELAFPSPTAADQTEEGKPFFLLQIDGEAMPYTSLYFLEQVAAGAWDTCQFIVNAGVLLQVDTRGESCSRANFKNLKSVGESLVFQEWAPKLATGGSHKRLTVGLSGRPAGPIFYISLLNNLANLGPKKADEADMGVFGLPPQADPCFAKVVRGEATIERINHLPVREGDTQIRMLQEFVTIVKATIVTREEALKLIDNCNPESTVC